MSETEIVTTPASGETAAPAGQPATPSSAPASPVATQPATPAPATAGAPEGWVPSYRIRETREAAIREAQTQWAEREASIRAEADQYRRQVQALTGVTPPQNPEVSAVKSQFAQLYPGLAKIEEKAARLEQLLERAGDLESQNDHYWQAYGRQTMDRLFTRFSETMGSPLTDEGKRQLHSSFVGWVQQSPELSERYASDPTIVEDFVKAFTASFIDPVRRTATATTVARATGTPGMPQDTPAGALRTSTPAEKPANLDERAAQAWALYQNRGNLPR